jgi:hypothetical protein
LLWIQRKLLDIVALHCQTQLSLNETLNQQCQEIEREQRLNTPGVLEVNGCDLVHGLYLLEAFFNSGLALVRLQDLRGGELAIVGQ